MRSRGKDLLKFLLWRDWEYPSGSALGRSNPSRWGYARHGRLFKWCFEKLWKLSEKRFHNLRMFLYHWYCNKYVGPALAEADRLVQPPVYVKGPAEVDYRDLAHEQAVMHKRERLLRMYDQGVLNEEEYYERLFSRR